MLVYMIHTSDISVAHCVELAANNERNNALKHENHFWILNMMKLCFPYFIVSNLFYAL